MSLFQILMIENNFIDMFEWHCNVSDLFSQKPCIRTLLSHHASVNMVLYFLSY